MAGSSSVGAAVARQLIHQTSRDSKQKKPVPSWRVFVEGATIYVACLIVPAVLANVWQYYLDKSTESVTPVVTEPSKISYYMQTYACPSKDSYFYGGTISSYFCGEPETASPEETLVDPSSLTKDMTKVLILSLILALIRIVLIYMLVPLNDEEDLQTLVRIKSTHLLSEDYTLTPTTPRKTMEATSEESANSSLWIPSLDASTVGLSMDDATERQEDDCVAPPPPPGPLSPSSSNRRTYAAPRYATAIFRLLYSTLAVSLALVFFRDADFWPIYVGGHGTTRRCWDLSGGLSVGMDSDFDHLNSRLKEYFLWQASYHWHSAAFHVLSMVLLVTHPKHAPKRFLSVRTSSYAYLAALMQHSLGLLFIGIAYIFSSLRRLTAIGLFAYDLSSWFLHLLQLCFNASEINRLDHFEVIDNVHKWLVLPTFIYCRLVVWALIWWSSITESQTWWKQLEQTLVPGSAIALQVCLHATAFVTMGLTIIHFWRLSRHPHLERLREENKYR